MNRYYLAGAVLLVLIGLIHSVLGEVLIFQRMRSSGVVPTQGGKLLGAGHVRIVWASWHVVSVLAWAVAALLVELGTGPAGGADPQRMLAWIVGALLASSALVGLGTRGRHPGWLGLLAVAALAGAGAYVR